MNADEIRTKPAGKELDQEIRRMIGPRSGWFPVYWSPSTNIGAAWEVVDEMGDRFDSLSLTLSGKWRVTIGPVEALAETAPLAICRAALLFKADQP